eukprot:gene376-2417_t
MTDAEDVRCVLELNAHRGGAWLPGVGPELLGTDKARVPGGIRYRWGLEVLSQAVRGLVDAGRSVSWATGWHYGRENQIGTVARELVELACLLETSPHCPGSPGVSPGAVPGYLKSDPAGSSTPGAGPHLAECAADLVRVGPVSKAALLRAQALVSELRRLLDTPNMVAPALPWPAHGSLLVFAGPALPCPALPCPALPLLVVGAQPTTPPALPLGPVLGMPPGATMPSANGLRNTATPKYCPRLQEHAAASAGTSTTTPGAAGFPFCAPLTPEAVRTAGGLPQWDPLACVPEQSLTAPTPMVTSPPTQTSSASSPYPAGSQPLPNSLQSSAGASSQHRSQSTVQGTGWADKADPPCLDEID